MGDYVDATYNHLADPYPDECRMDCEKCNLRDECENSTVGKEIE